MKEVERLFPERGARTKTQQVLEAKLIQHLYQLRAHRRAAEGPFALRFGEHNIVRSASAKQALGRLVSRLDLIGPRRDPDNDEPCPAVHTPDASKRASRWRWHSLSPQIGQHPDVESSSFICLAPARNLREGGGRVLHLAGGARRALDCRYRLGPHRDLCRAVRWRRPR